MSTLLHPEVRAQKNFLPLNGTDYIELYVGNARQAAYFHRAAFGMRLIAYAGPETGVRNRASYVLQQGGIRFVLTAPLRPDGEIAEHVHRHGDGVHDIALCVDDARLAWKETTRRGARSVREPFELRDEHGAVKLSTIATYGDTVHTFVERGKYRGAFMPGYRAIEEDPLARPAGLLRVDHMAGNVGWNEMNRWADFYSDIMGFSPYQRFDDKNISIEYSTLMSKVMADGHGLVKLPINEPAESRRKSQIEEYLEFYHGPGVQHIAFATDNILNTASQLQKQGVAFLKAPRSYYASLESRIGRIDEPVQELEQLGILVDRDAEGYLLQVFTQPVEDRPTLFYEIIQRKGSRGFGKDNLKTLSDALAQEQAAPGNL